MLKELLTTNPYDPVKVVDYLATKFEFENDYDFDVGVFGPLTLRHHTLHVMGEFEKYFPLEMKLPESTPRWYMRLLLALHDVGKSRAVQEGDKKLQHKHTKTMIDAISHDLPVDAAGLALLLALLNGDPLGQYLKGLWSRDECIRAVCADAESTHLKIQDFMQLMMIYYQCDVSAYTSSVGHLKALDILFFWEDDGQRIQWNEAKQRLQFSPLIEEKVMELERCLEEK